MEEKKTWQDIFKQYNPGISDKEIENILWKETCYPFDDVITVKQIETYFSELPKSVNP